jgi:hypothetical protein
MSARVEITQRPLRRAHLAGGAPRLALYVLVGVLSLAGIASIARGHKTINEKFITTGSTIDLAAADYATEFVRAYLTYDTQNPGAHAQAVSRFTNATVAGEAGISPQGRQGVMWAEPVQEQHPSSGGEIVTVAVQTSTASTPQYLAVPVARGSNGALAITDYPSFVGPPAVNQEYSAPGQEAVTDSDLTAMVTRVVTNYLSDNSQNLQADLAPNAQVSLPTVALTVQHVNSVTWALPSSTVEVQLTAQDSAHTTFSLAYLISVTRRERWYATSIDVNPAST